MAREIPIHPRIIEESAKATIRNLIDGIVELITNSDDSYKRLEEEGHEVSGKIEIYVNREKGGICKNLRVKDWAEGMTSQELESAITFGGETSGFHKGRSVRGFFGRGLKETIIALGEGEIKTVKNGKLTKTKLWLDKKTKKPLYDDEALSECITTSERNGTEVNIIITNEKIKIPEYRKFKEQLCRHYALRDINSSSNREIKLIFEDLKRNTKNTTNVFFSYPQGKKVVEKEIVLPKFHDKVKIKIYESSEQLDSPRLNPYGLAGILIKTPSAILDNSLFKFENDPAALYFYGEAICYGLEDRIRKGETEIIDYNRGGLEWRHEYCKALAEAIEKVLEPLILKKRGELEKIAPKAVKESTKSLLNRLRTFLNRVAKEELDEESDVPPGPPEPFITSLVIKPEMANLTKNKPRAFSIYAPTEIISREGQEAHIKSDHINIKPLSSTVRLKNHPKYPSLWYNYFKVVGVEENAEGVITVNVGREKAFSRIKVGSPKKKEKGDKPTGRKAGFIIDIVPNPHPDPPQRAAWENGVIRIYTRFPSVSKFLGDALEGVEKPEGRLLLAELVGEAFCRALAMRKMEYAPTIPGKEMYAFNALLDEIRKKYLHQIQNIIFRWKF